MMKYSEKQKDKLWCEVCDQGFIRHVIVTKLNQQAYICEECDAMWLKKETISDRRILDFEDFMQENNLPWNWDELTLID